MVYGAYINRLLKIGCHSIVSTLFDEDTITHNNARQCAQGRVNMGHIRKRVTHHGGRRYQAMVRRAGVQKSKTFTTHADAVRWIQAAELRSVNSGHSFAEALERYEAVLEGLCAKDRPNRRRMLHYWMDQFGAQRDLETIQSADIARVREQLQSGPGPATGKRLAPATINRYMAALSSLYTTMVRDWQWVSYSPFTRMRALLTRFLVAPGILATTSGGACCQQSVNAMSAYSCL